MSENILEVKGLTKDYGDFVLDKLTFTVPKGVIMGLIGENGAGKSTTMLYHFLYLKNRLYAADMLVRVFCP